MKFTEAGGVTLSVVREAEMVVFRVADTGIGIGPSELTHLFEGFFQADATLARRYGGAGVGLAVSSQLAQLMGGEVSAASTLGEGSVFTLTVPLRPRLLSPCPLLPTMTQLLPLCPRGPASDSGGASRSLS